MDFRSIPYPRQIKVGGQIINVNDVERIGDGLLGECSIHTGVIEIARVVSRNDEPSDTSKRNTFFHELTHAILGTMRHHLNDDEQFVSTFSSFLTEALADAKFIESDNGDTTHNYARHNTQDGFSS